MGYVECGSFESTGENDLLVSVTMQGWTHEKDIEVGERKPREQQVESIVYGLHHECYFAHARVVGTPNLGDVNQGVNLE